MNYPEGTLILTDENLDALADLLSRLAYSTANGDFWLTNKDAETCIVRKGRGELEIRLTYNETIKYRCSITGTVESDKGLMEVSTPTPLFIPFWKGGSAASIRANILGIFQVAEKQMKSREIKDPKTEGWLY